MNKKFSAQPMSRLRTSSLAEGAIAKNDHMISGNVFNANCKSCLKSIKKNFHILCITHCYITTTTIASVLRPTCGPYIRLVLH